MMPVSPGKATSGNLCHIAMLQALSLSKASVRKYSKYSLAWRTGIIWYTSSLASIGKRMQLFYCSRDSWPLGASRCEKASCLQHNPVYSNLFNNLRPWVRPQVQLTNLISQTTAGDQSSIGRRLHSRLWCPTGWSPVGRSFCHGTTPMYHAARGNEIDRTDPHLRKIDDWERGLPNCQLTLDLFKLSHVAAWGAAADSAPLTVFKTLLHPNYMRDNFFVHGQPLCCPECSVLMASQSFVALKALPSKLRQSKAEQIKASHARQPSVKGNRLVIGVLRRSKLNTKRCKAWSEPLLTFFAALGSCFTSLVGLLGNCQTFSRPKHIKRAASSWVFLKLVCIERRIFQARAKSFK